MASTATNLRSVPGSAGGGEVVTLIAVTWQQEIRARDGGKSADNSTILSDFPHRKC